MDKNVVKTTIIITMFYNINLHFLGNLDIKDVPRKYIIAEFIQNTELPFFSLGKPGLSQYLWCVYMLL